MANNSGHILMAMDWRGMLLLDLPVVIKTRMGNPNALATSTILACSTSPAMDYWTGWASMGRELLQRRITMAGRQTCFTGSPKGES